MIRLVSDLSHYQSWCGATTTALFSNAKRLEYDGAFVNFSFHSKMDDKSMCSRAPHAAQQAAASRKPRFSLSQHPQVPSAEQLRLPGFCPSAPRDP